jgi:Icc-related predicted phosphoesterase
VIRVAATGDVHFGADSAGTLRPELEHLHERADLFLIAGDLTNWGTVEEAQVLADELRDPPVPTVAVLGNHDYQSDQEDQVRKVLEEAGIVVLEGETAVFEVGGEKVGVAGTKGFGGGFAGACGSDFGEPEMKAFIRHTQGLADRLEACLREMDADHKIALMHFSPVEETLKGERLEIYPFLGSYLLAEAIDRGGADLAVHGHAHVGTEKGVTASGVQVRNACQFVIRNAYRVYCLGGEDDVRGRDAEAA